MGSVMPLLMLRRRSGQAETVEPYLDGSVLSSGRAVNVQWSEMINRPLAEDNTEELCRIKEAK